MSIWLVDADAITLGENTLDIIYQNNRIKEYLYSENSSKMFGLAGTKGQGKTFLIKAKRNMLQTFTKNEESYTHITCFPKDASMVDTLDNSLQPHRSIRKYITSYDIWVQIWKYCLALTIICSSDCAHFWHQKDFDELSNVTKQIMRIRNDNSKPSVILSSLLSCDINDFKIALEDNSNLIKMLGNVSSAVYIFIDKVEQAFDRELNSSIKGKEQKECIKNWYYSQYSLAQASYDIYANCNSHIKVYYTIRHEVLLEAANMAPNLSSNINGFLIELHYSKQELYEMFALYVQNESKENLAKPEFQKTDPEKAFLGFNNIPGHAYVKDFTETTFDYLYRHSLRRPRDLMTLCREIYLSDPQNMDLNKFRRTINDVSGKVLKSYLSEVEPFIVLSRKNIEDLLKSVNTNIFDFDYMRFVCERINSEYGTIYNCKRDCNHCKSTHPFTTLYNIGLLGYLYTNNTSEIPEQRFLPVGDSKLKIREHGLKNAKLYFLHPCLCDIARNLHKEQNRHFKTADETVVGEGIKIDEKKIDKITSNLVHFKEKMNDDKIFISSTVKDQTKERKSVRGWLFNKGLYPILSDAENFKEGSNNVDSHDHCIDEMLKCKHMIFIIGKKIGGKYAGNKYKNHVKSIFDDSKNKIKEPSISLMEFYVAKKAGIKYHVFINNEVLEIISRYNCDKSINLNELGIDDEVADLVNFINHITENGVRKGNWMIPFKSINDLKNKLNNISFAIE